ncbi:glutaminyl-peptide cyclotransferase [Legionella yabuuchiae]|uniref:glutaminyl-peptide cyclotransferase n=1 Tax=Legionella yabuuchiae TaxID=376727 RepID=UPI0010557BBD|nr:glutaminyl-peptide cyclotransferase [Legionella yabuuchiae]
MNDLNNRASFQGLILTILIMMVVSPIACSEIIDSLKLKNALIKYAIPKYDFKVVHIYPHDTQSFTQGLLFDEDKLYESQGIYGHSKISIKAFPTMKPIRQLNIPSDCFSEGIAIIKNNLYLLTYREHEGFVFDKSMLTLKESFQFNGEGWGLTSANNQLIMSNGSGILTYLSSTTFKPLKQVAVKIQDKLLSGLNELEYANDKIYANVLPTSIILIVSPLSGQVESWLDIESLKPTQDCPLNICVANGIAYNPRHQSFLVTGKYWPSLYEIKIT